MDNKTRIDISSWVIAKTIIVLLLFYLLWLIRDIIALFFVVLILVAALNPIVNNWEKKVKRTPAVILLFILLFVILAGIVSLVVPPLIGQITQLINDLPEIAGRFNNLRSQVPYIEKNLTALTENLTSITGNVLSFTASIFGGVFTVLSAVVITAYFLLDKDAFANFIISILPPEEKNQILSLFDKIGQKLGNWLRGQVVLGFIIGVVDFIGLFIIGVPYALALAVVSGLLEIVPTIGPILAGAIAVAVALITDPIKAIFVVVFYVLVQQLENNFLAPKIMQKAVGLSPVIIIFAVLIGAKLLGIMGAVLAVPVAAAISVIVQDWSTVKKTIGH